MSISILPQSIARIDFSKWYLAIGFSCISILLSSQSIAAPLDSPPSLCPSDAEMKAETLPNQTPYIYRQFVEGAWNVTIAREYRGDCKLSLGERIAKVSGEWVENSASPINLNGATFGGTKIRHVYTWQKDGRKYLIIWQPADERFIRLQIINAKGVMEENVLLPQVNL